jgi:hypothetical protein
MPSSHHDALVELVEQSPQTALQLLKRFLDLPVPDGASVRARVASVRNVPNVELRADVVLEVQGGDGKWLVVEVQRWVDRDKLFRWPRYVTVLRDDHRCEVRLVVLAMDEAVASWARRPIRIVPGTMFVPLVVGPSDVPRVESLPPGERTVLAALLSAVHLQTVEEFECHSEAVESHWPLPRPDYLRSSVGR